jgi:sulfur relay (sulfurtransferase) DsrC/TusE family protein
MKQHTNNAYKTESASHYANIRRKELHDQYWNREKSSQLAHDEGVNLNSDHWAVILYLRKHYLDDGRVAA